MNYSIGDFLIRIKNAYMARKKDVVLPYSKVNLALGKIMAEEGYIKEVSMREDEGKKILVAKLLYKNRMPALYNVKIISKPSLHSYVKKSEIATSRRGSGVFVISTNKGIMTDKKAKKEGIGGKVLCQLL